jgi:putative ABC transport system permease protein
MLHHVRLALRALRKNPSFTAIAVLTLAAGIGATAAMFSVVEGVLLRPLNYPNASRIVQLSTSRQGRTFPRLTGPDLADITETASGFERVSFYFGGEMGVQLASHADFAGTYFVAPQFFSVFGVAPAPGRDFSDTDVNRSAVVSLAFAQRNFGSSVRALSQTLRVEGVTYEITGVMPADFAFPAGAQVWLAIPSRPGAPWGVSRTAYNYRAVATLKLGVQVDAANAELTTIGARLQSAFPDANRDKTFVAVPLQEQLVGSVRTTLYFLMGAVSLVLVIACANVANLLLARATARRREMAVRAALGATRGALVRQMFVESGVLAIGGATLGCLLAVAGTRVLTQATAQQVGLPRLAEIEPNWIVLTFAVIISIASTLLFGSTPAWQAAKVDATDAFKQAGRGLVGSSGRTRTVLVVVQVALAFALAIGGALFFKSFVELTRVDLGFRTESRLVTYAHRPARTLDEYLQAGRFVEAAVDELKQIGGITSAAAAMGVPTGQYGSNGGYAIDGQDFGDGARTLAQATFSLAGPGYFDTMGISMRAGRDFTSGDRYDRPAVAIISESLARQSFPGQDPIGHTILCGLEASPRWMTIVGVVADTRQNSPASPPGPTLYMPLLQYPFHGNEVQIVMRTSVPPASLIEPVRAKMRSMDPATATKFSTMDTMVSNSIATPRLRSMLIALFAGLALLLAMTGMYGVMSCVTFERLPEFGVRMAFGASSRQLLASVLVRAARLAVLGAVIGLGIAYAAARAVSTLLFGITATDGTTYAVVLLAVTPLVILAAALPAWRASRIDPLRVLHAD